jgi:hypothetical protein
MQLEPRGREANDSHGHTFTSPFCDVPYTYTKTNYVSSTISKVVISSINTKAQQQQHPYRPEKMKTSATMSFFILALTLVVIPLIAEAEESDDAKKAAEDFFLAMTQS